jgi:chitin disaccharide deacetylase
VAVVDGLSSELLGYRPDARVLIVNCEDFGMHEAVNAAVVESIENGIASSCSLMVPCPAAANAMRLLRERPHIPFGIHLSLIRDSPEYYWGPAAAKADVHSLLDPGTEELFVDTPAQRTALLAVAKLTEVERELRAQIDAVVDVGIAPTHLDWHCLADGGRADILDLTMALAQEYGLAARVWLDDGRRKARQQGKPVVDNAFLDSYSVSPDDKAATYARLLRDLPPGLNEWPSIQRTAPSNGGRSSQPAGKSGKATTRSSPHNEHARSWIVKASPSSTTGHCNRRGTPVEGADVAQCSGMSPEPRFREFIARLVITKAGADD